LQRDSDGLTSILAGFRVGILTDEIPYSSSGPRELASQALDLAMQFGAVPRRRDLARLLRKQSCERSSP